MEKKLYILPFDHRASFVKMLGLNEATLTAEDVLRVADYKHIVYEGFLHALELGVPRGPAAILVDEQFGRAIHEEARVAGITRILTTEKSGQDEFDFEYGDAFGVHINALKPDYVKVLVRYNPHGDAALNIRQQQKLKIMNDFCHANQYQFLFELLVGPTGEQWMLMKDAIRELQNAGIEPDVWKLEGLEDIDQMRQVVEQARTGNRGHVGVIVLGRGESEERVRVWLSVAAKISGVTGFAVGRTVFKQPLIDHLAGKISRVEAMNAIAHNFQQFVDLFVASARV